MSGLPDPGAEWRVYLRWLKARLTGVTPCDYTTRHGHDLQYTGTVGEGSFRALLYRCRGCNQHFDYNQFQGLSGPSGFERALAPSMTKETTQ